MQQKSRHAKCLSLLFCTVLIAAAVLLAGCKDSTTSDAAASDTQTAVSFTFTVVDADGKSTDFSLSTTEKTVGAALEKEGLIAGETAEYGLYVKTVNGITLDFDRDGKYWAFYENGKYAANSADKTVVKEGGKYAFKVE